MLELYSVKLSSLFQYPRKRWLKFLESPKNYFFRLYLFSNLADCFLLLPNKIKTKIADRSACCLSYNLYCSKLVVYYYMLTNKFSSSSLY